MPREHIDFRSLLERVLPLESLTSAERAPIHHALRTGVAEEIEQAALLALAQLERHGAMLRLPAAENGNAGLVRYQTRDRLDIITLHLPEPRVRDGVRMIARASLPAQAQAALVHVRRLLRLDEPLFSSDPRTGDPRAALLAHLDEVGRELLGAREVRFVPTTGPAFPAAVPPLDEAWTAEAIAHPAVLIYCPDTAASAALRSIPVRAGIRSFALSAVTDPEGQPIGVLEVRSGEPGPFGPEALALVALIADCCGSALARASRIERLVFVDPLTGAYNRAYFDLQMRNEMARAQRESASLALCIADIDDFKSFNSTFGYEAGNQVLSQVVQALRSGVRPFDTVCRWGGEEFAVLLTAPVHEPDVQTISERLRALVERQSVRLEGLDGTAQRVVVTVSIGVAVYPQHETTPGELWRAANQALLRAKRPPKNQVVFYSRP
jgi:diguanylate cyclase (GGDEF)-like protein